MIIRALIPALLALALATPAGACTLRWDMDPEWDSIIDGFRLYRGNGDIAAEFAPTDRSAACADAGITAATRVLTMVSFRGSDESDHSAPAVWSMPAPGRLRIEFTIVQ